MQKYEPFDILHSPLDGTNLIEASAGTGKTYTLTALFIRLVIEKGLPLDRILTVTFTEAATNELKERVRSGLLNAMKAFSGRRIQDPFLESLALKTEGKETARRMIGQALRDFDRAAIFTIHGFCMRVLTDHAFESGVPFDSDLVTDVKALHRSVVDDFWRKELSGASRLFVTYALANGFTRDTLLALSRTATGFLKPRIIPRHEHVETIDEERNYLDVFKRTAGAWLECREEVCEILLGNESLKLSVYPQAALNGWIGAMDEYMVPDRLDPLLFKGFEKFTASEMEKGTKKGHSPPEHPFFHLCELLTLARESLSHVFDRRILFLKVRLFNELEEGLKAWKSVRNLRSFDDLLKNVLDALRSARGDLLATTLRSRFGAALIDEFQDTDPVQYGIFKRLFGGGSSPLFLIGDPKQSIYGFRGADVFAYMEAARAVDRRYTLPNNYRSEPGLTRAVNTLFLGHDNPFALRDIPFHEVSPAHVDLSIPELRLNGSKDEPFRIWFTEADETIVFRGKVARGKARELILNAVASEIARLVDAGRSGKALLGDNPLREADIAVLLRTNEEAWGMQQVMARRGISSVLYTSSSLFEAEESQEMVRILSALARPEQEYVLRAAMATVVLGSDATFLDSLSSCDSVREDLIMRFRTYHEVWKEKGFFQSFRELLRGESILQRLLALHDGERRATNLLHLSEVLHQAEEKHGFGMQGLVKWLLEQRDPINREAEEHPLRLESDRDAVKLVTIHKSKGLEYPVVFCPFLWEGAEVRKAEGPVSFHDVEEGSRLTIDLGSPTETRRRHISLAEQENLSENLRILYVALTRARNRCYAVWGRFNRADTSAPAYLFHTRRLEGEETPVRICASRFAELDEAGIRADLDSLEKASGGTIRIAPLPKEDLKLAPHRPEAPPRLSATSFSGRIDRSLGIASFSSLTSRRRHALETPDHDSLPDLPLGSRREGIARQPGGGKPAGLTGFPAGARSGTCLHSILESLDFTNPDPSVLSSTIMSGLMDYGFDPAWEEAIRDMVYKVISSPMDPGFSRLCLNRVSMENRLNELSFFFPLNRVTPDLLREVLARHTEGHAPPDLFPERIGRLRFSPVRGFMRGFVDLVLQFEGRWYIVDWKSNDLGPELDDYDSGRIAWAMADGHYHLQYLLYTLALDQYLARRIKDYQYSTHFGGVYYVFLRGVDPAQGPGSGVFGTLPSEALIRDLKKALIPALITPGPAAPAQVDG